MNYTKTIPHDLCHPGCGLAFARWLRFKTMPITQKIHTIKEWQTRTHTTLSDTRCDFALNGETVTHGD